MPPHTSPERTAIQAEQLARLAPLLPEVFRALQHNRGRLPDRLEGRSLGLRHGSMLVSLSAAGPGTVSELAGRLGISNAHASLVVGDLARAGMIEREHDPDDRRRVVVSMSDAARRELRVVRERMDGPLLRFLGELSPAEADTFTTQLRRFAEILGGDP